jgi:hypothetical protein
MYVNLWRYLSNGCGGKNKYWNDVNDVRKHTDEIALS